MTSQDGNLHGRPGAREQVRPCDVLALRRRARRPGAREQVRPCDEEQGKTAARRREQQGVCASSSRAAGVRHREEHGRDA